MRIVRDRSAVVTWRNVPVESVVISAAGTMAAPNVLSWCSTWSLAPAIGVPSGRLSWPVMSTFLPYRLVTTPRRLAANVARIVAFGEAPTPLSGAVDAGDEGVVVTRVAPPTAPCVG